jgi:hypothetical protein
MTCADYKAATGFDRVIYYGPQHLLRSNDIDFAQSPHCTRTHTHTHTHTHGANAGIYADWSRYWGYISEKQMPLIGQAQQGAHFNTMMSPLGMN